MNVGSLSAASRPTDSVFIRYFCPQAKNGSVLLLIDTGADYSLIKRNSLKGDISLDTKIIKDLRGAFGGFTRTEGSVKMVHTEGSEIELDMHCVGNAECLPADGILGRDNLWNRSIVDTRNSTLKFFTKLGSVIFNMRSIDGNENTDDINLVSNDIVVSARSVTTLALNVATLQKMIVIEKKEIASGIHLGGSATRVIDGKAFASILNTTEKDFTLNKNFEPKYSEFKNFKKTMGGLIASAHKVNSKDRVNKILESIKTDGNLNDEERASINSVCTDYQDIFHLPGDPLTCTKTIKHRIPTLGGQQPINQRQYRLPQAHRELIHKHVEKLEHEGKVRKSLSAWNAPLLLVPKKDSNEGRMVVDFRKLNDVTIKQVFPIPRMDEILDQLGRSRYFSTLDLESGYHQVEIEECDREKTGFSTSYAHYEFTRMPFGLAGAPMTFQRLMNHVLTGLQGLECFVYLDDIVVYGGNLAEHEARLRKVLQRLRQHNLKVKSQKCNFLRREIVYLGHKCTPQGCLPDPSKSECVTSYPIPRNKKEIQSFLGLVNYYRKFIPGAAYIALPLNRLIRKDAIFNWSTECQEAFEKLKSAIASPPVLSYPDFDKEFTVTTDASNFALGAILSQIVDGEDRPISYASRALCDAETRYSTIEKEFLAIVWAIQNYRAYLLGRHFTVYSDHKPLMGIVKLRSNNSRLARFHFKLAEYDFEIKYKAGKKNQNADALSRIRYPAAETCIVHTRASAEVERQALADQNKRDKSSSTEIHRATNSDSDQVDDNNSIWYDPVLLESKSDIETVLKDFHDKPLGGHQGFFKTYDRIKTRYRWKGMKKDVQKYIRKCVKCQKNKSCRKIMMPMVITDTPDRPFRKVYMDMVGPVPETASGHKLILSIQDDFSKYMICAPMADGEAHTVARTFVGEWIAKFGVPSVIISDNGSNFISKVFSDTCKILGIRKLHTTPYHPQSNGSLEKSHASMAAYLRCFVAEDGTNWDQYLTMAMHIHNNSKHVSTGLTPFRMLYGFDLNVPTNLKRKCTPLYNPDDASKLFKFQFQRAHELARENLTKAKQTSKRYYDMRAKPATFTVGEKVLLRNQTRKTKFSEIWKGPYEVMEINSPENTTIRVKGRDKTWHNNHLRKFVE